MSDDQMETGIDKQPIEDIPLRPGEDGPMWTMFLANLDPSLQSGELEEFFRNFEGGSKVFSAQVISDRASGDSKGYGFVHYTDNEAYRKALEEAAEVEIRGRKAKGFPAEDKKKLYIRGLPKDLSEDQIKQEIEAIGGKYEAINVRGG